MRPFLILHIVALDVLEFYGNLRVKLTHDNCNQIIRL